MPDASAVARSKLRGGPALGCACVGAGPDSAGWASTAAPESAASGGVASGDASWPAGCRLEVLQSCRITPLPMTLTGMRSCRTPCQQPGDKQAVHARAFEAATGLLSRVTHPRLQLGICQKALHEASHLSCALLLPAGRWTLACIAFHWQRSMKALYSYLLNRQVVVLPIE